MLLQELHIFLHGDDLLRAVVHHVLKHVFFFSQKLDLAHQYAAKLLLLVSRLLKAQNVVLALLRAKSDFLEIYFTLGKLIKLEAFLLTYEMLIERYFPLLGHEFVVAHLDCELEWALIAIHGTFCVIPLQAGFAIVKDERLFPCALSYYYGGVALGMIPA